MRIISGKYKGKKIEGFCIEGTRPTMDRIKESLFSMIQNQISNSICLDLFAGSGSIGIEALSNGAKKCYFVDNGKKILPILKRNLKGIEDAIFVNQDYQYFLNTTKEKFDLIFLDPPYSFHFINTCLDIIIKKDLLNKNGLIICEYESEDILCSLEVVKEKKYGNKKIIIYKK